MTLCTVITAGNFIKQIQRLTKTNYVNLCCKVEAHHLDVTEKRDLVAVRVSRTESMRYFCAEMGKCQNLCTRQRSYKVAWGWERS